jgi:hypothetical protein
MLRTAYPDGQVQCGQSLTARNIPAKAAKRQACSICTQCPACGRGRGLARRAAAAHQEADARSLTWEPVSGFVT